MTEKTKIKSQWQVVNNFNTILQDYNIDNEIIKIWIERTTVNNVNIDHGKEDKPVSFKIMTNYKINIQAPKISLILQSTFFEQDGDEDFKKIDTLFKSAINPIEKQYENIMQKIANQL